MPRAGEDNVGYLVNQSARLLNKQLGMRLREIGLTQGAYALIRSIDSMRDRPVTATELADDLRMESSALGRAIERAVTDGWIATSRHPDHPRARLLELTPKAKAALPVIVDAGRWTQEMALNGFTHEEVAQLKAQLLRLVRNLEHEDVG